MKRLLFIVATLLALLVGCRYESVDEAPALAIGEKFYGALQAKDGKSALAQFEPSFKTGEPQWPRLLGSMQERHGAVTSAELRQFSLSPKDDSPCFLLTYAVQRTSLATDEKLLVCRTANGTTWSILGHELTRLDDNQTITGGIIPTEVGVKVP